LGLILASRSPQRRAILEQLGIPFEIRVPEVEELTSGPPHEVAVENAFRKASAVSQRGVDRPVLGVDTLVAQGHRIYGKPSGVDEARATLQALSGRRHAVVGGVCLISDDGRPRTAAASTTVTFGELDRKLLEWYLETGEWRERAGAYAIQGRGAALVKAIEGDYSNVVGLPVALLLELAPDLLT
jgi:septum formation protein